MTRILVLVDFTETANIALDQAIVLAKLRPSQIIIGHAAQDHGIETLKRLIPYQTKVEVAGLSCSTDVVHGDFFNALPEILSRAIPDIVIVGTHGKLGLKQNLFGANIYKLVRAINAPVIVVSDRTRVSPIGFKNVLMAVASHKNYRIMVKQTCEVLSSDGKIILFAIMKPGVSLSREIEHNIAETKKYLDEKGVDWDFVNIDSKHFSVGYSKDTLDYTESNNIDRSRVRIPSSPQCD